MKIKIKAIVLALFILIGNLLFSQNNLNEEEKLEKIYLLEEYRSIKSELNEKILYIQGKVEFDEEFYREILLEYENLQNELLKDIKKVESEFEK